jgi:putative membrane protein
LHAHPHLDADPRQENGSILGDNRRHRITDFCMRFALILAVLVFAALGAMFGALNNESIAFDFYFGSIHAPKGAAFVAALLLGWLGGGLVVYLGLVPRLRRRLRALARELKSDPTQRHARNASAEAVLAARDDHAA